MGRKSVLDFEIVSCKGGVEKGSSPMSHYLASMLRRESGEPWGVRSRARLSKVAHPKGAIIFVHGFRGDAWSTWLDFPGAIATAEKAANYDLFFYGYDSRQSASSSAIELVDFLRAVGESAADRVTNPSLASGMPLRKPFSYEALVLCAHSLGAVVSRLALLDAVDDDESPCPWLVKLRLVLFAPAHSGALIIELASLCLGGLPLVGSALQTLARARYISLRDLDPQSDTLKELRKRTRKALAGEFGKCHRAWVAHAGKDKIVLSNKFLRDRTAKLFKDASHTSICKPTQSYKQPLQFVLEVLP